jgi:hypothetical protein
MSNALAISAVTAVLQYYLGVAFNQAPGLAQPVKVSCVAPDQIDLGTPGSGNAENQVNLFLHQVTYNAAWRNANFPSLSKDGSGRLANPPLALNLHYLLTAYGSDDWQAEALLGYALMMLHECPTLTRGDLASVLTTLSGTPPAIPPLYSTNPACALLSASGIADQVEMLKVVPETLNREEMAWLWTALKADYRPTFPFQVSVVLLDPAQPTSQPLPVLTRRFSSQPMATASLAAVQYFLAPASPQTAALPGGTITLFGDNLTGAAQALIANPRYDLALVQPVSAAMAGVATVTLPDEAAQPYPAGMYEIALQYMDPSGSFVAQTTNALPLAMSPTIPPQLAGTAAITGSTLIAVTIEGIAPAVLEGQAAQLSLSYIDPANTAQPFLNRTAQAQPFGGSVTTLTFQMEPGLPAGKSLLAQLIVDGVSSQVAADWTANPPVFTGPWVTL